MNTFWAPFEHSMSTSMSILSFVCRFVLFETFKWHSIHIILGTCDHINKRASHCFGWGGQEKKSVFWGLEQEFSAYFFNLRVLDYAEYDDVIGFCFWKTKTPKTWKIEKTLNIFLRAEKSIIWYANKNMKYLFWPSNSKYVIIIEIQPSFAPWYPWMQSLFLSILFSSS